MERFTKVAKGLPITFLRKNAPLEIFERDLNMPLVVIPKTCKVY